MCVYIYMYMCVYIYNMYMYIYIYIYIYTHVCTCAYIYIYTYHIPAAPPASWIATARQSFPAAATRVGKVLIKVIPYNYKHYNNI